MCGIAGIINLDGGGVNVEELSKMSDAIKHRGPDGEGLFCRGSVGFVHRRLAIIDPLAGVQPFYNADKTIVLSYNGEVYNYVEIRRELEKEYSFTTESDTEVVMHAYEKWGIACLEKFRGMFAFSLYDFNRNVVYLVRDRVGIKPLVYYRTTDRLLFASEISSILCASNISKKINSDSLSGYLRYQYVPTPATIYKNMYKLEPGHFLKINLSSGTITNHCYWNLNLNIVNRDEHDWLEEFNALLDETLSIYVRSDVPFGAFLSGGVDSSLVTAAMKKHLNSSVQTFSIGFNEEKHSELQFAAEVSKQIGTKHFEKIVSSNLAEEILAKLVTHFGEPFGDSSAIPTYYVSHEAAGQVKMVLSGDGGDELFAGYNSYQTTFRDFSSPVHRTSLLLLNWMSKWGILPLPQMALGEQQLVMFQKKHDAQRQSYREDELRNFLHPEWKIAPPAGFSVNILSSNVDPVTWFQAQDFKTYMVDDVLTKVDRMSMANSLEVRVPLLDHKIVELAFSLPLSHKIRFDETNGKVRTKHLLKKSASRYYSESFLARPKQGFGIPIVEWCKGELRTLIRTSLSDRSNQIFEWLQFDSTQILLNDFYAGNNSLVARIWHLFMLSLWSKYVHEKN